MLIQSKAISVFHHGSQRAMQTASTSRTAQGLANSADAITGWLFVSQRPRKSMSANEVLHGASVTCLNDPSWDFSSPTGHDAGHNGLLVGCYSENQRHIKPLLSSVSDRYRNRGQCCNVQWPVWAFPGGGWIQNLNTGCVLGNTMLYRRSELIGSLDLAFISGNELKKIKKRPTPPPREKESSQ